MSGSVVRIRIHKVAEYGSNFGSKSLRLLPVLTLPEFEIDGGGPAVGLGQHGMLLHLTLIHQCDCQLILAKKKVPVSHFPQQYHWTPVIGGCGFGSQNSRLQDKKINTNFPI